MRRALWLVVPAALVAAVLLRSACGGGPGPASPDPPGPPEGPATAPERPPAGRTRPPRAARPDSTPVPADDSASDAPPSQAPPTEVAVPAATADLPEGEIPEADRGTGECSLDLDVRDPVTDAPLEGRIRLWRLGVPADAKWPAGDQVQKTIDHRGTSPRLVGGLPPGLYRAEILCAAPGAEDPPPFRVDGESTTVRLTVAVPPVHAARVRIVDETGATIPSALVRRSGSGGNSPVPMRAPAWATPRNPLPEDASFGRAGGFRSFSTGWRDAPASARPDGLFDLGTVRGPGRSQTWSASWTLRPEGRTTVRASFRSEDVVKGDLCGVSVPLAWFEDAVRLPDGRTAREAGVSIQGACDAIVLPPDAPADAWRAATVRVTATLEGHRQLELTWRPGEPPPAPVVMQTAP